MKCIVCEKDYTGKKGVKTDSDFCKDGLFRFAHIKASFKRYTVWASEAKKKGIKVHKVILTVDGDSFVPNLDFKPKKDGQPSLKEAQRLVDKSAQVLKQPKTDK